MAVDDEGRWLHFEFGINVARQNGKGAVLEARELAMLFLTGERLGVHSAHEFKTSQEHFRRVKSLIQNTPALDAQVKRNPYGKQVGYRHSHGEESIELQNGNRLLVRHPHEVGPARFRRRRLHGARRGDDHQRRLAWGDDADAAGLILSPRPAALLHRLGGRPGDP